MLFWQATFLGIIEGITEFLPISSTFHLLFGTKFLGIPETEFTKFFDVFIQAGAMLPVFLLYLNDWLFNRKLWFKLGVSFVPTVVIALLLKDVIKGVFFESNILMIAAFALVGVLFIVVESMVKRGKVPLEHSIADMTWSQAIAVGIFQGCAVLPGVSRAGAVIIGMMLLGFKRDQAAKYSFLLGAPTIMAAAGFDLLDTGFDVAFAPGNWLPLLVGFVTAFISSLLILQWFINYLRKNSLQGFGVYRLLVAGILVVLGFWR